METGPSRPAASCPRTSAGQGGERSGVRVGAVGSGWRCVPGRGRPLGSLVGIRVLGIRLGGDWWAGSWRRWPRAREPATPSAAPPAASVFGAAPCLPLRACHRRARPRAPAAVCGRASERARACGCGRACVRARGGGPESGAATWGGSAEAAPPRSRSRSRGPRPAPAPGPPAQAAPRARRCRPCRRGTGCGAWRSSSRTSATVSGREPDPACVGWGRRPG